MSGTTNRVPAALPDDPNEVAEALEVAGALWEKGDRADAIRWVRRAAEAAADAGDTTRLAALARGAADLEQASVPPPKVELHSQTRSVAPPVPPSRPSIPPPLPSRPPRAPSVAPSAPSLPPAASSEQVLPSSDLHALPPSAPSLPSSAPLLPSSAPSLPSSDRLAAAPPDRSSDRLSLTPSERISVMPSERISLPSSSRTSVAPVSMRPPPGPWAPPAGQTQFRVSVRASVRDGTLLVVRPLADGEAPPPGTREALLVLPEPLDDLHANGSLG